MYLAHEISALTATSNPHTAKIRQESRDAFAASLDQAELKLFMQQEQQRIESENSPAKGVDWWFERLMSDINNQEPPASKVDLAKEENRVRRSLGMEPNRDTLFTEFLDRLKAQLNTELSPDQLKALEEQVWAMVDQAIEDWQQKQEKETEGKLLDTDLAMFDQLTDQQTGQVATAKTDEQDMLDLLQQMNEAQGNSDNTDSEQSGQK